MLQDTCDKACEILSKTNDGEDLAPQHLYLLQEMVNGHLNETGEEKFYKLWESVVQTGYVKPWFHGIEHLTINHQGYVLWKGKAVEHYDNPWRWTEEAKAAAEEVASRCRILEERGEAPNVNNVIMKWPD